MSNQRFSIIPGWIVCDPRLVGRDLQVLCLLGRHTDKEGWCRRSQVKMAEQLSCARSTVQAALDRLSKIGVVEKRLEPSRDGRDSAHWYRVIFDAKVADETFEAWENEEYDPISASQGDVPPAGIPAPPAGPESAPPAGSGPAPINEDSLTTATEREEREGASENGEEEENPKSLERRFRKWWSTWPSYAVDSEAATRREWLALTPQQRRDCEERTPAYLANIKSLGRKFSKAAATYLSERAWERIGEVRASAAAPSVHRAFSRAWQALRLSHLLAPEAPLPKLTSFLQGVVLQRSTPEECQRGDGILRDHRARYAWPKATEMNSGFRPVQVPSDLVSASEDFKSYRTDSPTVAAWKRLHERRGWPWPEMGGAEWICFPTSDGDSDEAIETALMGFMDRIGKGQGDEHAA